MVHPGRGRADDRRRLTHRRQDPRGVRLAAAARAPPSRLRLTPPPAPSGTSYVSRARGPDSYDVPEGGGATATSVPEIARRRRIRTTRRPPGGPRCRGRGRRSPGRGSTAVTAGVGRPRAPHLERARRDDDAPPSP